MSIVLDSPTPKNEPLSAKYKRSFAYPSMKDRLPVILSKLVDNLYREKQSIISTFGEESREELKAVIGEISKLKNQLQTGKPLEKFSSDDPDTSIWNAHIESLIEKGDKLNYYESDWLFAECYLYRKIREIFATQKCLRTLDPFSYQKTKLLADSLIVLSPLFCYMENEGLLDASRPLMMPQKQAELVRLLKCSLWANRLDLSLMSGTADVQADLLQEIEQWDDNILVNDISQVSSKLLGTDNCNQVVDIVTDNSGVEVLCDLCLADFLVTRCYVKQLNFRVKPIPWYISDVMSTDLYQTVKTVQSYPDPIYQKFGERWQKFLDTGVWQVKSDRYWCLGFSYCEMTVIDPDLYNELSQSSFIIFKGDLNYRKLVQDINWDPTTSFHEVLGKFHPAPLVTLRTMKADTICGLKKGLAETMNAKYNDWLISGKFAVVQLDFPNINSSEAAKQ